MALPLYIVGLGIAAVTVACKGSDVSVIDLKDDDEGNQDSGSNDTGLQSNNGTNQTYFSSLSHVGQLSNGEYADPTRSYTYGVASPGPGEMAITTRNGYTYILDSDGTGSNPYTHNFLNFGSVKLFGETNQDFSINQVHDFVAWTESASESEFIPERNDLATLDVNSDVGDVTQVNVTFQPDTENNCTLSLSGTWYQGNADAEGPFSVCIGDGFTLSQNIGVNPQNSDVEIQTTVDLQTLLGTIQPDRDSASEIETTLKDHLDEAIQLMASEG